MTELKIRLFVKTYCPWCHEAVAWLDKRQIQYELFDVNQDAAARAQMFSISNQTLAPVIEVNGNVLADFDTGQLERWWRQSGF